MAMYHFEGFDIYDTTTDTDIAAKADDNWDSSSHTNSEINIKPGRYAGYAVQYVSDVGGTGDAHLRQDITGVGSTAIIYVHFNYKFPSTSEGTSGDYTYIKLYQALTLPFPRNTELRINEDKEMEIWHTQSASTPDLTYNLPDDTSWHNIIWKYALGTSVNCKVYLDGEEILNSTETGNDIDRIEVGAIDATSTYSIYIDDIFICDNSGNGFTGRPDPTSRITRVAPNADTTTEDWSLSSGTDSYALIDELPHNSDTDYIHTSAASDDTVCEFTDSSPATGLGVVSVRLSGWWRNESAIDTLDLVYLVDDGTLAAVGSETSAGTTYLQKTEYFLDQHPRTSSDWTTSTFDGSDWGVRTPAAPPPPPPPVPPPPVPPPPPP
jgi:hypothetical protein